MDFMTIKQASEKWGICTRRVQTLCTEGRIDGAERLGHQWVIPINAEKPKDARIKSGRYIKTKSGNGEKSLFPDFLVFRTICQSVPDRNI